LGDLSAAGHQAGFERAAPDSLQKLSIALCAAAFAIAWVPRLHWGLWTDEAGTFWMACQGWRAAIGRTGEWAGQSVLYSIIESLFVTDGYWKEPLLRLPSVAASIAAAWQLKRTVELCVDRSMGWIALVPFFCAPDMMNFGTSARPYALALAASLSSFRYLMEWQRSAANATAVKYVVSSILTLHLHYLFAFVFVIQGAYVGYCSVRRSWRLLWLPAANAVALGLSLLPLLGALRSTARQSADFAQAAKPPLMHLFQACFPPALLLALGLGGLMLFLTRKELRWKAPRASGELAVLGSVWIFVGPILFWLVAQFTDHSIFAARYLLFTLPATVIAAIWLTAGLERPEWRRIQTLSFFAVTVLHPATLLMIHRDSPASWREPLALVARSGGAPVFVESGLAQSGGLGWQQHDPSKSHLFAALSAYPVPNRSIPLPYQFSDDVQKFVRERMASDLWESPRVMLVTAANSPTMPWMLTYMQTLGYTGETHELNDYTVVEFHRP
jgi:hypothetical protein